MKDDFYGKAYEDIPRKAALQTWYRALDIAARYTIGTIFKQVTSNPILENVKAGIEKNLEAIKKGEHKHIISTGKKLVKLNRHNRRRLAALQKEKRKK